MRRQRLLSLVAVVFAATVTSAGAGDNQATSAPGKLAPEGSTLPTISGTPSVGQVLTGSPGTWTGPIQKYSFQWARCNSSGAACSAIAGATQQTQLLTANDVGTTLRVSVTASNKNGATVATSNPTSPVSVATTTTTTSTLPSTTTTWSTTTTPPTTSTTTTTATTTTPVVDSPYFSDSFDNGIATLWQATPARSTGLYVTQPGNGGNSVGLQTTAASYTPNTGQLTSLWLTAGQAHSGWNSVLGKAVNGVDTWYHQEFRFPAGAYTPTTGHWNWLVEWHDDSHTASYGAVSTGLGVFTDYPVIENGVGHNPRLVLRLAGGNSQAPNYDETSCALPANTLLYDHWYDSVQHIYWSTSSNVGRVEWWLDGVQICSKSFPTLFSNPDGTFSYNTFGIYNYHSAYDGDISVHFDDITVGPSRSSVGG
jgi:hypothetical protein